MNKRQRKKFNKQGICAHCRRTFLVMEDTSDTLYWWKDRCGHLQCNAKRTWSEPIQSEKLLDFYSGMLAIPYKNNTDFDIADGAVICREPEEPTVFSGIL